MSYAARMRRMASTTRFPLFLTTVLLSSALLHCGDDTGTGGTAGGGGAGASGGNGGSTSSGLPANEWTFVDVEGSICMNGDPTGFAINPHETAEDIVIYLQGGNACFDILSCAATANLNGYDASDFADDEFIDTVPYLNRSDAANPYADFNLAFVPYCSGDVYAGDRSDADVGNGTRQFHGFKNIALFVEELKTRFPNAKRVVLTGQSAGGFGAAYNYDQVATAFGPDVKVTLIDDSGPPMSVEFVSECLQRHFKDTWGLDNTLPADCAGCADDVWMEPFATHLISKTPERSIAIISSHSDETISNFWAFGENDCANLNGPLGTYPPGKYLDGLEDLRDRIAPEAGGRFGLFLIPGAEHVFTDNPFGSVSVDGVLLEDWIRDAIAEDGAWGNVPAN